MFCSEALGSWLFPFADLRSRLHAHNLVLCHFSPSISLFRSRAPREYRGPGSTRCFRQRNFVKVSSVRPIFRLIYGLLVQALAGLLRSLDDVVSHLANL